MDQTLVQAGLISAQAMINKALAFDPASQQKIAAMAPKVLAIHTRKPSFSVYITFGPQLTLNSHFEGQPDAELSGDLTAFINLASQQDKHAALMQSDIQMRGSSQLAMGLADVMSQLKIDWEAMIAKLTGPVVAHVVGKNLRALGGWLKNTSDKFKQDSVEFVRDELQLSPHRLEGESQFMAIHKLKLDAERLEARIQRFLQNQQATGNKP